MKKIPLIIVAGPTASGKTALSISLAKHFSGEIISADSMQIYKYMDIGTAKPTEEEKCGIPHHLMDFLEPCQNFSAADYCDMAKKVISDIHSRGKLPILVGGTGLYIDSLASGVDFGENTESPKLRRELESLAKEKGNEAVFKKLKEIDPETAEKYHPNNIRRVIRALEFFDKTGMTISAHAKLPKNSPYTPIYFCIDWEREVLYERINKRVDKMIKMGLLDEARNLFDKVLPSATAMQAIGYKELSGYFNGTKTLAEATDEIKQNSRRYAKRQLTWFKRNPEIHFLSPETAITDAVSIIEKELQA